MGEGIQGPIGSAAPVATLVEALERVGASARPWLTFVEGAREETCSGQELHRHARRWASALSEAGVLPGSRVGVFQPNGADFVGSFFGALLLGASAVPLPWPVLPPSGRNRAALEPLIRVADLAAIAAPQRAASIFGGGCRVVTSPAAGALLRAADLSPESPAFIQFTSGSTSEPRGAVISHGAAIANAWTMGESLAAGPDDLGVSWIPLFHDMGLVGVLLFSLLRRVPVQLMTPAEFLLHPSRWIDRLAREGATLTVGPNFAYDLVVQRVRADPNRNLRRLRAALNGSEPVHRESLDAFAAHFGPEGLAPSVSVPVYGLAENALAVTMPGRGGSQGDLAWEGRRVPSVGSPVSRTAVEVRIGSGAIAAEGEAGRIWVQSPSVMSGYFRAPEETARVLVDGWLDTGDLGVARDGHLYITGREKDLIIRAGQKFHPYDIERVAALAADAPPNGAAAFSALGTSGSEELVVVVELRRAAEGDVTRRIRGCLLEELGIRADHILLVGAGDLPRTTSGKVRRHLCAQRYGGRA